MDKDLDRTIAEKVMGWEYTNDLLDHCNGYARIVKENAVSDWFKWTPDTDIGQAMMVVEKMREKGYGFSLELPASGGCYAELWKESNWDTVTFKAEHNDIPALAICRAVGEVLEE